MADSKDGLASELSRNAEDQCWIGKEDSLG